MATIKAYTLNLWRAHKTVAAKLGMDISWGDSQDRVRAISTDVMLATLIKALTDKGVLTDTELNALYTQVTNATFPTLPPVPSPDLDHGGVAPDPDLGA